ncbi:hypothetical protein HanIR_Chr02g0089461 [Helianthus annuus]|nr:hypothetical protein HanIR_Chr02g0089461 [Helianthus annuus]
MILSQTPPVSCSLMVGRHRHGGGVQQRGERESNWRREMGTTAAADEGAVSDNAKNGGGGVRCSRRETDLSVRWWCGVVGAGW